MREGRLAAWGMPVLPKLRREAAAWFPQLRGREPRHLQKGELVFRCSPAGDLRFSRAKVCEPQCVIFLEQKPGSGFELGPMRRQDAVTRLEKDLMAELPEAVDTQAAIINRVADLPRWHLQYSAPPQVVAERLSLHFDRIGVEAHR
jgi:hypothetical protein